MAIELPPLPHPIEDMTFFVMRRADGWIEIWAQATGRAVVVEDRTFIVTCNDRGAADLVLGEIRRLQQLTRSLMR
jgi:hypothetical protein